MSNLHLAHLDLLEHEAIHIIREAVAQLPNSAILFSGGKDSLVLATIARKAFAPALPPLPLLHIDTGHNFPETLLFRDAYARDTGYRLLIRTVQSSIDAGRATEESGVNASRNVLQTVTLLDAIAEFRLDCAFGGGRRDEEKARAKERIFSHRDGFGQWDPKNQRPELWNLYNGRKKNDEHFRVFPLSNWTESDIWAYILREKLPLPSLYFSHEREVFTRNGALLSVSPYLPLQPHEQPRHEQIRFRTVGDMTCTGAIRSPAATVAEIATEVAALRQTERGTRSDDRRSETAMEDRKRQGYF
ncbi:sulfate adenylyltransferase subunit CysD [Oleiharenicola lentus]|uniref:sulfate adenylyltransferase subunit CysD n=1 Tax=Oleiharenicola lentus TaxID=2508720 RepID=UPI003F67B6A0